MGRSEQEKKIREYFKSLVLEHPDDIKSLGENDFKLIANALDGDEINETLILLTQIKEVDLEGNKKTYLTVNVGGVRWMTENLAYDDGEKGILKVNGNYYYQQYAARRVAKKLGWILPSPETWNALCEARKGELLNAEVNDPLQYNYEVHNLFSKFNFNKPVGFLNSSGELKGIHNNSFWTNRREGNSVVIRRTFYPTREITASVMNQYNYLPVRLIR